MSEFSGRNVVVLGLGLTGYSLARHLAARGAYVRVADTRVSPPFAAKLKSALPAMQVMSGPFTAATFADVDLIAISPGVAKDQPAIAAAVARGADHRIERQVDGDRTDGRAVPRGRTRYGGCRQHR